MARYVVPVVVLLAMVGGYVVGQQPTNALTELDGDANGDGKVDLADMGLFKHAPSGARHTSEIGRYVPFEGGKMLDTTNGTLYAMEGNPTQWKSVATMAAELPAIVPY